MNETDTTTTERSANGSDNITRLPLWKAALEELIADGIEYGQIISAKWFEDRLKCERDTMRFGLGVSDIRRELEKNGFYLSGRGQSGSQFIILPPENNRHVMAHYQRCATDALKRGVILGTSTPLDRLETQDRKRHEAILERMAIKAALMSRSRGVMKALGKKAGKLLGIGE